MQLRRTSNNWHLYIKAPWDFPAGPVVWEQRSHMPPDVAKKNFFQSHQLLSATFLNIYI